MTYFHKVKAENPKVRKIFNLNLLILIFPSTDFATKLTNYKHVRIKVQIKIPHIDKTAN